MMTKSDFFKDIQVKGLSLTARQMNAVVHEDGPLLLLAVPGAGKTTVLTVRLAYLIQVKKIDPRRILCLTFGRAAAKEMRERFLKHFGDRIPGEIHFSTIHSFAYEVVRTSFRLKGIPFELIEERTGSESKTSLLRQIFETHNSSNPSEEQLEELQNSICYVKNTLSKPEELDTDIKNFVLIYKDYEKYKRSNHPQLIDYDDMLMIAFEVFKQNPKLLETYRKRFDYILTDESQDTSLLQHKVIELIARPKNNLFVVGDDDQSIFGFRAAEPKYLLDFKKTFPEATILRMEQNFRSTPQIVSTSCQFIRTNQLRFDKAMYTENPQGEVIRLGHFKDNQEQFKSIIEELRKCNDLSSIGILYRNNLSAISLAEELTRANLSFYMRETGKLRFFSHWAIQDILNFLRFSFSDKSLTVFERIWTKLPCRFRKHQIDQLKNIPIDRSLFEILSEQSECSTKNQREYQDLQKQFKALNKLSPAQAIRFIREDLEYDKTLRRICASLGFSEEHILGLLDILASIAQKEKTIVDFANRLTSLEEQIKTSYVNKGKNAVTLTTIHSAKGLEWDQVYLIDLIEGIIPERESIQGDQQGQKEPLEEERRLFYVGMTRAKKRLTLCSMDYYHKKRVKSSRFVREVNLVLGGQNPKEINFNKELTQEKWGVGLVVEHKTYGEGVILTEDEKVIVVQFKDGTQRNFLKDICEQQKLIWAV